MNEHLNLWLDAYLDGELPPQIKAQVDEHLAACPQCQALLNKRRSLSDLLHTAPLAADLKPAEQFVAEVSRKAGVKAGRPLANLNTPAIWSRLWQLAPLVLLLAWAFMQSVSIVSLIVALIPGASQILQHEASILRSSGAGYWLEAGNLSGLDLANLDLLLPLDLLGWNWITSLLVLAGGALFYVGWLASWWALSLQTKTNHKMQGVTK
jgi:hypothetical protein